MDVLSFIGIIIAIAVIYFVIRFILSPIIRAVVGIIIFLILVYLLQRFFGFDLNNILAPFGISPDLDWVFKPINYFADQIKNFWNYIWKNVPQ